jgi:cyclic nucleotide gated channel
MCKEQEDCRSKDFYCVDHRNKTFEYLYDACLLIEPDKITNSTVFNFGIFTDALSSGVLVESSHFWEKFFYCFWWGLRNLRLVIYIILKLHYY